MEINLAQLKNLLFLALFISSCSPSISFAAFVVETWSGVVALERETNFSDSGSFDSDPIFGIGSTIAWTVTYDLDNSNHYTSYSDGNNQIAERGSGDDTLSSRRCLDMSGSPNCTMDANDGTFIALYDSVGNFQSIYDAMVGSLSTGETIHDYFSFNQDWRRYRNEPYPDYTDYDYYSDEFHVNADNRQFPAGGQATFELYYQDASGDIWQKRVSLSNITIVSSTVPLPPAGLLFVLALSSLITTKKFNLLA